MVIAIAIEFIFHLEQRSNNIKENFVNSMMRNETHITEYIVLWDDNDHAWSSFIYIFCLI